MVGDIRLFKDDEWPVKMGRLEDDEEKDKSGLFSGKYRITFTRLRARGGEPRPVSSRPAMGPARPAGEGKTAVPTTFHLALRAVKLGEAAGGEAGGRAARHQLYIERECPGCDRGELIADEKGPISFGSLSLGASPEERAAFWQASADVERRMGSRVQGRVIGELPHWVPPAVKRRILERWAEREFAALGVPYWVATHRADVSRGGDPRNDHFHVNYCERPAERVGERHWRFARSKVRDFRGWGFPWGAEGPRTREARLARRLAWRPGLPGRPLRPGERERMEGQLDAVRQYLEKIKGAPRRERAASAWARRVRRSFAEVVNEELLAHARAGGDIERLYDPRSYREAGVGKLPTEHLGPRQTHAERAGMPMPAGARNRRRERFWLADQAAVARYRDGESVRKLEGTARELLDRKARELPGVPAERRDEIEAAARRVKSSFARALTTVLRERAEFFRRVPAATPESLLAAVAEGGGDPGWWLERRRSWADARLAEVRRSGSERDGRGRRADEVVAALEALRVAAIGAARDARAPSADPAALGIPASSGLVRAAKSAIDDLEAQMLLGRRGALLAERKAAADGPIDECMEIDQLLAVIEATILIRPTARTVARSENVLAEIAAATAARSTIVAQQLAPLDQTAAGFVDTGNANMERAGRAIRRGSAKATIKPPQSGNKEFNEQAETRLHQEQKLRAMVEAAIQSWTHDYFRAEEELPKLRERQERLERLVADEAKRFCKPGQIQGVTDSITLWAARHEKQNGSEDSIVALERILVGEESSGDSFSTILGTAWRGLRSAWRSEQRGKPSRSDLTNIASLARDYDHVGRQLSEHESVRCGDEFRRYAGIEDLDAELASIDRRILSSADSLKELKPDLTKAIQQAEDGRKRSTPYCRKLASEARARILRIRHDALNDLSANTPIKQSLPRILASGGPMPSQDALHAAEAAKRRGRESGGRDALLVDNSKAKLSRRGRVIYGAER